MSKHKQILLKLEKFPIQYERFTIMVTYNTTEKLRPLGMVSIVSGNEGDAWFIGRDAHSPSRLWFWTLKAGLKSYGEYAGLYASKVNPVVTEDLNVWFKKIIGYDIKDITSAVNGDVSLKEYDFNEAVEDDFEIKYFTNYFLRKPEEVEHEVNKRLRSNNDIPVVLQLEKDFCSSINERLLTHRDGALRLFESEYQNLQRKAENCHNLINSETKDYYLEKYEFTLKSLKQKIDALKSPFISAVLPSFPLDKHNHEIMNMVMFLLQIFSRMDCYKIAPNCLKSAKNILQSCGIYLYDNLKNYHEEENVALVALLCLILSDVDSPAGINAKKACYIKLFDCLEEKLDNFKLKTFAATELFKFRVGFDKLMTPFSKEIFAAAVANNHDAATFELIKLHYCSFVYYRKISHYAVAANEKRDALVLLAKLYGLNRLTPDMVKFVKVMQEDRLISPIITEVLFKESPEAAEESLVALSDNDLGVEDFGTEDFIKFACLRMFSSSVAETQKTGVYNCSILFRDRLKQSERLHLAVADTFLNLLVQFYNASKNKNKHIIAAEALLTVAKIYPVLPFRERSLGTALSITQTGLIELPNCPVINFLHYSVRLEARSEIALDHLRLSVSACHPDAISEVNRLVNNPPNHPETLQYLADLVIAGDKIAPNEQLAVRLYTDANLSSSWLELADLLAKRKISPKTIDPKIVLAKLRGIHTSNLVLLQQILTALKKLLIPKASEEGLLAVINLYCQIHELKRFDDTVWEELTGYLTNYLYRYPENLDKVYPAFRLPKIVELIDIKLLKKQFIKAQNPDLICSQMLTFDHSLFLNRFIQHKETIAFVLLHPELRKILKTEDILSLLEKFRTDINYEDIAAILANLIHEREKQTETRFTTWLQQHPKILDTILMHFELLSLLHDDASWHKLLRESSVKIRLETDFLPKEPAKSVLPTIVSFFNRDKLPEILSQLAIRARNIYLEKKREIHELLSNRKPTLDQAEQQPLLNFIKEMLDKLNDINTMSELNKFIHRVRKRDPVIDNHFVTTNTDDVERIDVKPQI